MADATQRDAVDRRRFQSSWILDGTYDRAAQELTVNTSGGSYTMTVPPDLWEGLCSAASPGSYFNANIRGKY